MKGARLLGRRRLPAPPPVRYVVELRPPGPVGTPWLSGAPLRHRSVAEAIMLAEARRHPDKYGPAGWARLRVRRIGGAS